MQAAFNVASCVYNVAADAHMWCNFYHSCTNVNYAEQGSRLVEHDLGDTVYTVHLSIEG